MPFLTRAKDVIVMTVEEGGGTGDVDGLVWNAAPDLHDADVCRPDVLSERGPLWRSRPAPVMLFASATDVAVVALLAVAEVLMTRSAGNPRYIAFATLAFVLALDLIKRVVFGRLQIG
jgi:hypothetical protein